jgi:hypothetical protein
MYGYFAVSKIVGQIISLLFLFERLKGLRRQAYYILEKMKVKVMRRSAFHIEELLI